YLLYTWHIAHDVIANYETYVDGLVQSPITCIGDPLAYLHQHLCALDNARDHGSQPERAIWDILEMRAYWRKTQSICQHMLLSDGSKTHLSLVWKKDKSLRDITSICRFPC
ncbi:S-adenosylmethionine-dependent methyltransferase, partial [Penicillium malachiteum]